MHYGLHVFGHYDPKFPPDENFQRAVEQVRTARENGFDIVWCGHHYLTEDWQKFQVLPAVSRFSAEAGDMYVGSTFILPLGHPIPVAEQLATIDAMSGGRAIVAPVAGYRDVEFESMDVPKSERVGRIVEGVKAMKRLWTEDSVTFEGRHFSFEDVSITPKPVQDPHPPIWIGASGDKAVRRASRLGDAWLVNSHPDYETVLRQLDIAETPSGEGIHGVQPARREVFVAESDEEAVETYGPALARYYDWYEDEGRGGETGDMSVARDSLQEDRFIVGSPETVADELASLQTDVGIDAVLMGMHLPTLDHEAVLRSIRLTGAEVMPRVERRL